MANPENITLRSEKGQPLTYEEMDLNMLELQNLIIEHEYFIDTVYASQQEQLSDIIVDFTNLEIDVNDALDLMEQEVNDVKLGQQILDARVTGVESDVTGFQVGLLDVQNSLEAIEEVIGDGISGARGGEGNPVFWENDTAVTKSYAITAGKNAGTFGPITIEAGVEVTVPPGSVWTIV